jgi:hypothetical protein
MQKHYNQTVEHETKVLRNMIVKTREGQIRKSYVNINSVWHECYHLQGDNWTTSTYLEMIQHVAESVQI